MTLCLSPLKNQIWEKRPVGYLVVVEKVDGNTITYRVPENASLIGGMIKMTDRSTFLTNFRLYEYQSFLSGSGYNMLEKIIDIVNKLEEIS